MTLRDWLAEGPFSVALCSGFFGFYAHCGFMRGLEAEGFAPSALAGSSAGALVAGLWAAGRDAADMADELLGMTRTDFWDPGPGLGLLRGRRFATRLERALPVASFERTRVPLAVSVWEISGRRTVVRTQGPLAPAIQASCSFPGLFQPVIIDGRRYLDGGIAARSALDALDAVAAPGERVLHHHLESKSPWRRAGSGALRIPGRPGLVAVVVPDLPRCGPFKMHRGGGALEVAERGLLRALDQPLPKSSAVSI